MKTERTVSFCKYVFTVTACTMIVTILYLIQKESLTLTLQLYDLLINKSWENTLLFRSYSVLSPKRKPRS